MKTIKHTALKLAQANATATEPATTSRPALKSTPATRAALAAMNKTPAPVASPKRGPGRPSTKGATAATPTPSPAGKVGRPSKQATATTPAPSPTVKRGPGRPKAVFTPEAVDTKLGLVGFNMPLEKMLVLGIIDQPMHNLLLTTTAPKNHPNFLTFSEAVRTYFPGMKEAGVRFKLGTILVESVRESLYSKAHVAYEAEKEALAAAKAAGENRIRRPKLEIQDEKDQKEAMRTARKNLGFQIVGRLSATDQPKLEAEIAKVYKQIQANRKAEAKA